MVILEWACGRTPKSQLGRIERKYTPLLHVVAEDKGGHGHSFSALCHR